MRKKEGDKEKAIIEAAIEVFAKEGYFDAKIHRIADIAGIASGTVYLYFGNKENILLKIFESVWEQLFIAVDKIHKRTDMNSIDKFNTMIDAVFDYFTSNPSLALVFVNEQNHLIKKSSEHFTHYYQKTLDMSEALLREGIKNNIFNQYLNPNVFSCFFFGGLRYLLNQWAQDQTNLPLNEIRQNVKHLVLNGITVAQKQKG